MMSIFFDTLAVLVALSGARALGLGRRIDDRPLMFPSILGGPSKSDILTHDTSMLRMVEPAKLVTLVETLRLHSNIYLGKFLEAHRKALQGKRVMYGLSYDGQALNHYNWLLEDYFPMNEAEMATAEFFFSQKECPLPTGKEMPAGMTACEYHGARILADIVQRIAPIHRLEATGSAEDVKSVKVQVHMQTPPEWNQQIGRIVQMLGSDQIAAHLTAVNGLASIVWNDIRKRSWPPSNVQ